MVMENPRLTTEISATRDEWWSDVGPHADLAAADLVAHVASFHGFGDGFGELPPPVGGGEPEAEGGGVVVTGAGAVTLDERRRPEVLQARSRRVQRLARAFCARPSVLK